MPIEWKNRIAVKVDELVPMFFNSYEHLKKNIQRHKDSTFGIKKLQSGGNGRELLIDFDSLSLDIREKLGDPRKVTNWMDNFYKFSKDVENYYLLYRFDSGKGLEDKHVKEYTVNACTLRAAGFLKNARTSERLSKGGSLRGIPTTIWKDAMGFKKLQKMKYGYEHTLPQNERRFLEALRKFDSEGLESLISRKHENKNAVKVTADVIELLNNLFAGRIIKPSASKVFREYMRFWIGDLEVINNVTGEVYDRKLFPQIDDRTILAYLSRYENQIGTWSKRAGDRQRYQNQFKITHRFSPVKMAGSVLSVDDRNPPFILPNGKRVWFYIGIDLASEAWTTYVHGTTKEGIIEDFYRNLVRDYASYGVGLPLELECESALNSGLTKSILEEGVLFQKVRIEKNNPTGKMIENYFRRIRYGLEKDEEGWQGRPFARNEANQTNTDKPITKTYDEIVETTIRLMQEWNNSPHPRVEGKTRWEVFMEQQNPECSKIEWRSILPRMGKETQTSCRVGYINLNSDQWCIGSNDQLATGNELIRIMKEIEGKKILVRWLDDKEGNVLNAKAYRNGRYICDVVPIPRYSKAYYERTEVDFQNQALMSAYSNTVLSFGKERKDSIEAVTVIDRTKNRIIEREVEVLEEREETIKRVSSYKRQTLLDRF